MSWADQRYINFPFLKTSNIESQNGLGTNGISIGINAGYSKQGTNSIAIGINAGYSNQSTNSVSIGYFAGQTNQVEISVAIGNEAGEFNQEASAVAIGFFAGNVNQGARSTSIGIRAGERDQGFNAVSIGLDCGSFGQSNNTVAIGVECGRTSQQSGAIAIGFGAAVINQGTNSIAIGSLAGQTNQFAGSIVLNATGTSWGTSGNPISYRSFAGTFIRPIRPLSGGTTVNYNATTFELTYGASSSASKKNTIEDLTIDTSIVDNLKPKTFFYNNQPEIGRQIGYIAEEVKMIHHLFARYDIPYEDPVAINYDTIVVFLAEELKKLKSTVDILTQQNHDFLERLIVLENK